MHPIQEIVRQNRRDHIAGICSVCSSNELVIESAMEESLKYDLPVLIEATANQVNQYGGYTGMTPRQFRDYVYAIAERVGFDTGRIVLGGDHLGPLTWKNEEEESAMAQAEVLVAEFVKAGFTKIHLDTSMKLQSDDPGRLASETVAKRGARLCAAAEKAVLNAAGRPVYVIGSEVPTPGGTRDDEGLSVTSASDFMETVEQFHRSFLALGLEEAWNNVVAVVVQPGVEFGPELIHDYVRDDAAELKNILSRYPSIVFEGHSTDYQTQAALRQMVQDGIAILKVGPALTFALREGLMSLERMEEELLPAGAWLSDFTQVLDRAMVARADNWIGYYQGSEQQKEIERKYSYSDRCRYYLNDPAVKDAVARLIRNLQAIELPGPLISQYFPAEYWQVRAGILPAGPLELVKAHIKEVLEAYYGAVAGRGGAGKKSVDGVAVS